MYTIFLPRQGAGLPNWGCAWPDSIALAAVREAETYIRTNPLVRLLPWVVFAVPPGKEDCSPSWGWVGGHCFLGCLTESVFKVLRFVHPNIPIPCLKVSCFLIWALTLPPERVKAVCFSLVTLQHSRGRPRTEFQQPWLAVGRRMGSPCCEEGLWLSQNSLRFIVGSPSRPFSLLFTSLLKTSHQTQLVL